MGISSAVLRCKSEKRESLIKELKAFSWLEVHYEDQSDSVVIVTLEVEKNESEVDNFNTLLKMKDVLSAEMVFHSNDGSEECLEDNSLEILNNVN